MIGLTRKVELLETKIDCGIQQLDQKLTSLENRIDSLGNRIELRLDDCAKRLVKRFDAVDKNFDSLSECFRSNLAALRNATNSDLVKIPAQSTLIERIARLELDIEQLKADAKL